jgi:hypothetical protein
VTDFVLGGKLQGLSDRNFDYKDQTHPDNDFRDGQPPRHSPAVLGDVVWLFSALLDSVEQGNV